MDAQGLEDEEALQGWFMSRMNDYIRSKGRTMMGWDEVTGSEVPEGAVVFGWRGRGDAAIKAAEQGHRFVLTPSELLYLIRYQGPQWFEPLTYFGNSIILTVLGTLAGLIPSCMSAYVVAKYKFRFKLLELFGG